MPTSQRGRLDRVRMFRKIVKITDTKYSGAGGGSRTRVSALGRLHNSRYTTPAISNMEPPWGVEPQTSALRKRRSSHLS